MSIKDRGKHCFIIKFKIHGNLYKYLLTSNCTSRIFKTIKEIEHINSTEVKILKKALKANINEKELKYYQIFKIDKK